MGKTKFNNIVLWCKVKVSNNTEWISLNIRKFNFTSIVDVFLVAPSKSDGLKSGARWSHNGNLDASIIKKKQAGWLWCVAGTHIAQSRSLCCAMLSLGPCSHSKHGYEDQQGHFHATNECYFVGSFVLSVQTRRLFWAELLLWRTNKNVWSTVKTLAYLLWAQK